MLLAVCSTPLQILNLINLKYTLYSRNKVDVIILNHSMENIEYYNNLKNLKIFNKIFFVDSGKFYTGENKLKRHLQSIQYLINGKNILNQIKNDEEYTDFILFSTDLPTQIIYNYYKDLNERMNLIVAEEGIFTYGLNNFSFSKIKELIMLLLFKRFFLKNINKVLVYKPEYLENKIFAVERIPKIEQSNQTLFEILNKIFNYSDLYKDNIKGNFVFFDQPFQNEIVDQSIKDTLRIISGQIEEKIQIKLHPRTKDNYFNENYLPFKTKIPFELFILNENISEKIIISVFSTACLTPKIMFDEEPYVIFLYKIIDVSDITAMNSENIELLHKVKSNYRNPEKFYIPSTIDELIHIINLLKKS